MTELRCQSCFDSYLRDPHIVRDYQNTLNFVISLQSFFLSHNKRYMLNQYPLPEQASLFFLYNLLENLPQYQDLLFLLFQQSFLLASQENHMTDHVTQNYVQSVVILIFLSICSWVVIQQPHNLY